MPTQLDDTLEQIITALTAPGALIIFDRCQ